MNRVDHFDFLLGGEAFLADERVRPFVEGRILTPNNRQNYACHVNNPSHDNCLANDTVVPSTLTIGSRFFPWKRGFSLLAAFDIGLGGTHDFIEELQPDAAVDALPRRRLGGGHPGPAAGREEGSEKVVEKGIPLGHIIGFVHEKDKNDPIVGAIATYRDHPEMSPLATGADGKFGDQVLAGQLLLRHQGRRLPGRHLRRQRAVRGRRGPHRLPARGAPARRARWSATSATRTRASRSAASRS